jgi:hypothetical protein
MTKTKQKEILRMMKENRALSLKIENNNGTLVQIEWEE